MNIIADNSIRTELKKLGQEVTQELIRLLNYWANETRDEKNGGFIGQIDHFGNINEKATKGMVLNARILWTFSSAYRVTGKKSYEKLADVAYHYLMQNFWDKEEGGFYWSVDYLGAVENSRKQAYAQGFGVYGLAEYHRATGHQEALEYAKELYFIIEEKYWDKDFGGYIEALGKDWQNLEDMRLSDKDANMPKSMNTHLHLLEPYACLYRVWPNHSLKASIKSLLHIFQDKIIDKKSGHFNLFFEMDWTIKSKAISFGHDIEGAWLMHEAAELIDDEELLINIQKTALNLVDITIKEGCDTDGALFNEQEEHHLDSDKHWWPQAEAMVGLVDAWQINGNTAYLISMEKIWKFIKDKLIDKGHGEWYWRVDKNGDPITCEDKVGFWKCPYHNGRALMEVSERINRCK
ncbi:AGE family epimerase/isomerase [Labilibacter marinus]|uniref:AGE family epimerase/isomerase n=1 Tax=Labilibacter marinus TaxID=1477105 RepID=UPI0009F83638|nr:AGE family epimerase/isomerase [Labilibacter marinus]